MLLCPAHPVIVLFELYFYFIFFSLVLPSPWFFKPPDCSFAVFQHPPPPPPRCSFMCLLCLHAGTRHDIPVEQCPGGHLQGFDPWSTIKVFIEGSYEKSWGLF